MSTPLPSSHKRKIFISYRVKDSQSATGRIADALLQHFDEAQIFMDVDKLSPGADFTQVIPRYLDSCYVMLVIIGPDWAGFDEDTKQLRINDPDDWVRREISRALERNILVIPVLVEDGEMPKASNLPEELQPLLRRQAYEISNKKWKTDVAEFIDFLKKKVGIESFRPLRNDFEFPKAKPATKPKTSNWKTIVLTIGAVIGVLAIIGLFIPEDTHSEIVYPQPEPQPIMQQTMSIAGTYRNDFGGRLIIRQQQNQLQISVYNPEDGITYGPVNGVLENGTVSFNFQENGYLVNYYAQVTNNGNTLSSVVEITQGTESYSTAVEFYKE